MCSHDRAGRHGPHQLAPVIQAGNSKNRLGGRVQDRKSMAQRALGDLLSTIFGGNAFLAEQQAWTVDAYHHDVTSKFKLVWEIRC